MIQFQNHDIPVSVCVLDMDWHLTTGYGKNHGWTGYTWNRELFPDPEEFISWLHSQGIRTCLNLHPADGVHPHEAKYAEMATAMGVDTANQTSIPFDIHSPHFALPYLKCLHHPHEKIGVDFWWLDWQQGMKTACSDLDPLWWLNHLHFYDLGRNAGKRPFVFSRWGGLGSHRTPIGFSGDTFTTWKMLAWQPYFTATAANVGYGWWSHDIGGHTFGIEDAELYLRWVQFGVWSPVFRLHSTKNPYQPRAPWLFESPVYELARQAMQRRHALIPLLYSLAYRYHQSGHAPIRPMYHDYADNDAAYVCPQQYLYGDQIIVAPFTEPLDKHTRLSRQVVWLPPGDWYDFDSGERVSGDQWMAVYGDLAETPVFVRAGSIVPLAIPPYRDAAENPRVLELRIYCGADGHFELYEDDGVSTAYQQGKRFRTSIEQKSNENAVSVVISPDGRAGIVPEQRTWQIKLYGLSPETRAEVRVDGVPEDVDLSFSGAQEYVSLSFSAPSQARIDMRSFCQTAPLFSSRNRQPEKLRTAIEGFVMEPSAKWMLISRLGDIFAKKTVLADYLCTLSVSQQRLILETLCKAGLYRFEAAQDDPMIVIWNTDQDPSCTYLTSLSYDGLLDSQKPMPAAKGPAPRFYVFRPAKITQDNPRVTNGPFNVFWQCRFNYDDILICDEFSC